MATTPAVQIMQERSNQSELGDGFIFWKQPLRVTGTDSPASVISKLQAQFSGGRFGVNERLSGAIDGDRVRAYRKGAIAASDVVQFVGTIRPHAGGVVIEGCVDYTPATRLQFAGLLAVGLALVVLGAFYRLSGATPGIDVLEVGAFISIVTMIWIYASKHMRRVQIEFIETRLRAAAAAA